MSGGKKETNDEKLISLRRQGQKVWKSKRERKKGICADFGNVPYPFQGLRPHGDLYGQDTANTCAPGGLLGALMGCAQFWPQQHKCR